ncbi:MAG: hypothetical protein QXL14_02055 [Candidatus Aenigmatarchaeota archaeon]
MGKSKGISTTEILVALALSTLISLIVTSLFVTSSNLYVKNKKAFELNEDTRNAIATIEYLFSRWGAGVPCKDNKCVINNSLPPCDDYPPSDPQCITIKDNGREVEFFGNLYGFGFITNSTVDTAEAISCGLSSDEKQNCYLVWEKGEVKMKDGKPSVYSINLDKNNVDCYHSLEQAKVKISLVPQDTDNNATVASGTYISRAPFKIRLYVQDGFLFVDKIDQSSCNYNEANIKIGKVKNFEVKSQERSIVVNITFTSKDGKERKLQKVYGK